MIGKFREDKIQESQCDISTTFIEKVALIVIYM